MSKIGPISLLNTENEVLQNIRINRFNHHVYSNNFMNKSHYGFTPQKSIIYTAIALNDFVEEDLKAGKVLVKVSLDVNVAFDASWWFSNLKNLRVFGYPKNLYKITKSYFGQRTAILLTNSIRMKR